jgi:hypothetical protein
MMCIWVASRIHRRETLTVIAREFGRCLGAWVFLMHVVLAMVADNRGATDIGGSLGGFGLAAADRGGSSPPGGSP